MKSFAVALGIALLLSLNAVPQTRPQLLFDDFSYTSNQQLKQNGWIIRTEAGWPGGASAARRSSSISWEAPPIQTARLTPPRMATASRNSLGRDDPPSPPEPTASLMPPPSPVRADNACPAPNVTVVNQAGVVNSRPGRAGTGR